jgi:UDP-N-acetylmuramoylalanine--D-glutamate ligase
MFEKNTKYGILGMARSGIAAAYKIKELGGKAYLSDFQPIEAINGAEELLANFECEFGGHTERLLECDEWIVSPGIPLNIPIITEGIKIGIPMISEIEFGYRIKAADSKIIAVTGSNGKSTTASFIFHIIKNMGFNAILAGNIGDAFCGYPIHKPGLDFIVLEISSFQLDLIKTFKPEVAVLLNITPDHLYRYQSFEHYASSKIQMFANQSDKDYAILNFDDPQIRMREQRIHSFKHYFTSSHQVQSIQAFANDSFLHFGNEDKLSIYELSIKGPHNQHNAMAAILAANALIEDMPAVLKATNGFKPLKHRLEYVRTINGVSFYNDSKATNMDSVHYALLSFDRPIRIIMGGSDKGEDYNVIAPLLKEKALMTYITGATSDKMRQAWLGKLPLVCIDDFEASIRRAFEESLAGDVIVLSPGCASFDRFRNFEHRGEKFTDIVNQIAEENEKK